VARREGEGRGQKRGREVLRREGEGEKRAGEERWGASRVHNQDQAARTLQGV
jgi:hypothetical protein